MRSIYWTAILRFAITRGSVSLGSARCSTTASCASKENVGNETAKVKNRRYPSTKHTFNFDKLFTEDVEKSVPGEKKKKIKVKKKLQSKLPNDSGSLSIDESDTPPSQSHDSKEKISVSEALDQIGKENKLPFLIMKTNSKMAEVRSHESKQIIMLAGLEKMKTFGIVPDKNFDKIFSYFVNEYDNFSKENLSKCLELILRIYNPDNHGIELLANIAAISIGKMEIDQLLNLLFMKKLDEELHSKIENECLEELAKRINEITNPVDMIKILNAHRHEKNKRAILKFENQILSVIDKMSVVTALEVLTSLSRKYSRNTKVIFSLVDHIIYSSEKLTLKQINRILASCAHLSVYEEPLMTKICKTLHSSDLSDSDLCLHTLTHFRRLQWREKGLLTILVNNIVIDKKPDIKRTKDILDQLCRLNFCPDNLSELLHLNDVHIRWRVINPLQWLTLVWCCTVLQIATPEMMSSVLEETFLETIKQQSDADKLSVYKSKLININCASCFDVEKYDGPRLSDVSLMETSDKKKSKHSIQLTSDVIQCMTSILPESEYYRKDIITPYGYRLDVELFVDSNGEAVKLDDAEKSHEGLHRLAFKALGFHDTLQPDKVPTGPEAMIIRHLGCQGYKIVLVPYFEWQELATVEKKQKYLKDKIKNVIY